MKRRVSNGSRPHRPHAALQLDVQGVPQAPFAIQGNPIMDNVARLNKTGLNGLSQCGTDGLQTVSLPTVCHGMQHGVSGPQHTIFMAMELILSTHSGADAATVCRDLSK